MGMTSVPSSSQYIITLSPLHRLSASAPNKGTHTCEHPQISTDLGTGTHTHRHTCSHKDSNLIPLFKATRRGEIWRASCNFGLACLLDPSHPPHRPQLFRPPPRFPPALTCGCEVPGWHVYAYRRIICERVHMWVANGVDTFLCK